MSENKKDVFEELYLGQKKKSSILLAVTVVLAVTTVGSLYWGFNNTKKNNVAQPPAGFENRGGQGFPNGGQMGGQMDVTRFFNEDGSVKTAEVQSMVDRLPSGAGSQFLSRLKDNIDQAAKDGKITQAQADALNKAFESAGGVNEN
jgi:hypothetical protein